MHVSDVDHLVLTVANIEKTVGFYTNVLGMTEQSFIVADGSTRTALMFGQKKINLHPADTPFQPHANHPQTGSADLCFLTPFKISKWIEHLEDQGIEVEEGPVSRTGANGPIVSVYIRDPDRNLIEISQYE